jgi:hypothetical protein
VQQFITALGGEDINVFGHKKKAVFVPANTTIGVTNNISLDFMMLDAYYPTFPSYPPNRYDSFKEQVNPFNYFTQKVKDEIWSYYKLGYDAMKKNGGYMEARLNSTGNMNEAGTLFGMWFAEEWPYYLNQTTDDYMGKYWFDGSILNLINVNRTNNETFYKDIKTGKFLSDEMIGMYGDADYKNVDNYTLIGASYMYMIEGDLSQGIVNLTNYHTNARASPVYMKYELVPSDNSIYDDLMYVEYFDNLIDAQASFTSEKITYIRSTQESALTGEENQIPGYHPIMLISILGVISVFSFNKEVKKTFH